MRPNEPGERGQASSGTSRGRLCFTLVGIFITKAAVDYNLKEAIGLDGALQKLANQSYGPWLLG